ncbi:MAG: hypothetical protein AUJ72_04615 [Candidatus Omnitrophica bacterium CG1_02_46_14]|nr:MAG: hypothetical protein AUJ72_04615 [Candidatus Omnitrophica bacterium CG1_02_46_14]
MTSRLSLKTTLLLGGIVIMASTAAIAVLSHRFVFGEGHLERPIIEFLLLILFSFVVYAFVFEKLKNADSKAKIKRGSVYWIILVAILCRLFYFSSALIQETDPYRYVWDGQTLLKAANPYQHSPEEAMRLKVVPADDSSTQSKETFERINHPGIRTIYPPLAQVFFAFSQILSPWSFMGLKVLIFLSEMIILGVLATLLKEIGKPIEWLVLYAWSPLVLKEYSNGLHLDVFAVLFLCAMIYACLRQRLALAFVALALSVLVKWFAVVLLPLLVVQSWKQKASIAQTLKYLFLFAGIFLVFYLPFLGAGRFLFDGLTRFSLEWRVNEGLFGLIRSRVLAGLLLAAVIGIVSFWLVKKQDVVSFGKACAVALASLFFLSPVANPWYFTWVIPFLIFLPMRSLVLFSGLVFLYYFDFYFMYRSDSQGFFWVRCIEYGFFFISLGWELCKNRQWPLFYPLPTNAASSETR